MKILLTGATGFLGRHLLPELAKRHEVYAVARRRIPEGANGAAAWVQMDLAAPLDASALPKDVDAVVHLAQSTHYREFPERARDVYAINVASTFALLDYARSVGVSRFIHASSGGIYGHGDELATDSGAASPLNFYLSSKYAAELLVASYAQEFATVVFRFFFIYGAGQTRMLIPTLVDRVLRGETVTVEGDPGLRINPVHVSDAVRVFEPSLGGSHTGAFNVAGQEAITMSELVRLIGAVAAQPVSIEHSDVSAPDDLLGDTTRMRELLGITPQVPLRAGLTEVVQATRRELQVRT